MTTVARRLSTTGFLAGLALWGVWAVSASPLFALFFEFRGQQLGECGKEWSYYAKLYSHFFLYPVTFGLISTAFLHRPWIRTVHHLRSLPARMRAMKTGLVAVSMLAVVGFVSYVEFTGSTPAPWSIAPEAMKSSDEGMGVRSLLELRCERASGFLDRAEKSEFQQKLGALWKDGDGDLSYTEIFYRAGFVAMTTLFAFLFATVFITTARYSKNEKGPEDSEIGEIERMMFLLAPTLLFATFWVLMRIAFLAEKLTIYAEEPLFAFNWLLFLVFVVPYVHLVIRLWEKSERFEKYVHLVVSIAGSVITVMEPLGSFLSVEWIPEVLVRFFGTGSTHLTYIAVLLFLFVVHFPHILRLVEKWGSDRNG